MTIYTAISVTQSTQICFVYKWTQISTGKWYIGSHTSKSAHPEDGYTCSSKIVKPMIKECPEDWVRIILETGSKDDMLLLEHELLMCLKAAQSEYSFNRNNGNGKFYGKEVSKETRIKMSNAAKIRIISTDARKNQSIARTGTTRTEETKRKMSIKATGRKHTDETKAKLSILNKREFSTETREKLRISSTGRPKSEETIMKLSIANMGKKHSVSICPHCGIVGGSRAMKQWHFDNCKYKMPF